jgi:hypothetical protein
MAKANELEIGQKWTLSNPKNWGYSEDVVVEIVGFHNGITTNIQTKVEGTNNNLNGLYPKDLREKVILNKETFEKLLQEKEEKFQKEIGTIKQKISYLEETGSEEYSETEFKVYQTLKTLKNQDLTEVQRTKIIASLINK